MPAEAPPKSAGGALRLPSMASHTLAAVLRELEWPAAAKAALQRAQIWTISHVAQYSPESLRKELEPHGWGEEPHHFYAVLVRHTVVKAAIKAAATPAVAFDLGAAGTVDSPFASADVEGLLAEVHGRGARPGHAHCDGERPAAPHAAAQGMRGDDMFLELPVAGALFSCLALGVDRAQLVQDALRLGGLVPCCEPEPDA